MEKSTEIAIGGLDVGTTGCKLTIFGESGEFLYKAYRNYKISRNMGEHEIKADTIWNAVKDVIKEAATQCPEMMAIGITSFGETFVMLDQHNLPILPSILYTDPRGSEECSQLVERIGAVEIANITGLRPHQMYSISKLMWIKKHQEDAYQQAVRVMLMEDYITYMLTGTAQIDYSLASRTMAFDIRKLQWSDDIFTAAMIDSRLFSNPVPSGTSAGLVTESMAEELNLQKTVKIVSVGHDQVAAAIGSGVFQQGTAVDGAGTVECITPVLDYIPDNDVLYEGSYAVVPYIIPGKYLCYAFSFTGGALVTWYIDHLAKKELQTAISQNKTVYEVLEEGMKDQPSGLLVLPHFAGAATPYMDSGSKGAIVGLTIQHNVSDIYRAMMEGVVYEMRLNLELLQKAGITVTELKATGGGATSSCWMQMKADILNVPVIALGGIEAGTVGCVIMTGLAVGRFPSLQAAVACLIKEKLIYYPRQEQHDSYMKYYEKYRSLYQAIRPLVLE